MGTTNNFVIINLIRKSFDTQQNNISMNKPERLHLVIRMYCQTSALGGYYFSGLTYN